MKSKAKVIFLFHPTLRCIGGLQTNSVSDDSKIAQSIIFLIEPLIFVHSQQTIYHVQTVQAPLLVNPWC